MATPSIHPIEGFYIVWMITLIVPRIIKKISVRSEMASLISSKRVLIFGMRFALLPNLKSLIKLIVILHFASMINVVWSSLDSSLNFYGWLKYLLSGLSEELLQDLEVRHILSKVFANSCSLTLHPCLVKECCLSETTI